MIYRMKYSYLQAMVSYIITVTIKISMISCLYSCWMYNRRRLFFLQSFLPIKVENYLLPLLQILNSYFLTDLLLNKPLLLKLTWSVINHCTRQPYFFLVNLYIKQGISSEYVMVDFICMVLLDLWQARTENYKMKSLSHSAIRTRDL